MAPKRKKSPSDDGCEAGSPLATYRVDGTKKYNNIQISGSARVHNGDVFGNVTNNYGSSEGDFSKIRKALFETDPAITDPESDRKNLMLAKGERVEGTCRWILENEDFQAWIRGDAGVLSITGGPGKGKTMLADFIVSELERKAATDRAVTLTYFFCLNENNKRNNINSVLRGVLYHLLRTNSSFATYFIPHLSGSELHGSVLSTPDTLWTILNEIADAETTKSVFCVFDGLDECDKDAVLFLGRKLAGRRKSSRLRIALLSRPIFNFHSFTQIRLDPDNDRSVGRDIGLFIDEKLAELGRQMGEQLQPDDAFGRELRSTLAKRAQGTFLWVGFAMTELFKQKTKLGVQKCLSELPSGLPALYGRMLLQIPEHCKEDCRTILLWAAAAIRPLSVFEMAGVLYPELCAQKLSERMNDILDMITECGSIIRIQRPSELDRSTEWDNQRTESDDQSIELMEPNRESDGQSIGWNYLNPEREPIVNINVAMETDNVVLDWMAGWEAVVDNQRWSEPYNDVLDVVSESGSIVHSQHTRVVLVHQSARDYLLRNKIDSEPKLEYWRFNLDEANVELLRRCVQCVSHEMPEEAHKNSLYDYASWALRQHTELVTQSEHLVFRDPFFFQDSCKARISWALSLDVAELNHHGRYDPLSCASELGVIPWLQYLLSQANLFPALSRAVNAANDQYGGETLLMRAAYMGKDNIVRLLLDNGADVYSMDAHGKRALHYAVAGERGWSEADFSTARILVDAGAEVDAVDACGETALNTALRLGNNNVARYLAQHISDINAADQNGRTPLILALEVSNSDTIRCLLDEGALPNSTDKYGSTVLHHAVEKYAKDWYLWERGQGIIKLLLEHHANVHSLDHNGESPVHKLLTSPLFHAGSWALDAHLQRYAQLVPEMAWSKALFTAAVFLKYEEAVKLLTARGAYLELKGGRGLAIAAFYAALSRGLYLDYRYRRCDMFSFREASTEGKTLLALSSGVPCSSCGKPFLDVRHTCLQCSGVDFCSACVPLAYEQHAEHQLQSIHHSGKVFEQREGLWPHLCEHCKEQIFHVRHVVDKDTAMEVNYCDACFEDPATEFDRLFAAQYRQPDFKRLDIYEEAAKMREKLAAGK